MQNQINLTPITQFIQLVRAAELSQGKEVKMNIQQARLLSLALAEIQDKLVQDYQNLYEQLKNSGDSEVVSIQLDGGGFSSPS